jgi:sugar phosphate permease
MRLQACDESVDPGAAIRIAQARVLGSLWTAYVAYYLCRANFAVAQPYLLREFPDWSNAQVGVIPSLYAACYAVGQLVCGYLADRVGARRMLPAALALTALANLCVAGASSYGVLLAVWAVNGLVQSSGWPLIIATASRCTTAARRGTTIAILSTSYQAGNIFAWLLAGQLAETLGWRAVFWLPSILVLLVAWVVRVLLAGVPEDATQPARSRSAAGPLAPVPWRTTLSNRTLWILGLSYFCLNAVRCAFLNWSVQYMADYHGRSLHGSALVAIAVPLAGAVGAVAAGWASDFLFGGRRAPVCALSLLGVAAVCVAFVYVPQGEWRLAALLLGAAGFFIYGPDMLLSGAAAIDFAHPRAVALATGMTMSLGAAGAIFSGAGVGWLRDLASGEWHIVFLGLAGLAGLSAMLLVRLWSVRPPAARRS